MSRVLNVFASLLLLIASEGQVFAESLAFNGSDGVRIYADYYGDNDKSKPIVLLFHQASSNAGEYDSIGPRLNERGFAALAIDQRSGGAGWGRQNRTAKAFKGDVPFMQALADLEAALDWAKADGRNKIVVWGSSYSASLVFLLAAKHSCITAVLSFSPGEYFGGGHDVRRAAAKVEVPIFVTSSSDVREVAEARKIFNSSAAKVKVQYRPIYGTHGSSTLRIDTNPRGAHDGWQAVSDFLAELK